MQIVLIGTSLVLIINAAAGLIKGLVGKAAGIAAFILSVILVNAALPSVTLYLRDQTPVYTWIYSRCEEVGANLVGNAISGGTNGQGSSVSSLLGKSGENSDSSASSSVDDLTQDGGTVDRDKVKSYLQAAGYDPSVVDGMSDDQLKSLIQQYAGAYAGTLGTILRLSPFFLTAEGVIPQSDSPENEPAGASSSQASSLISQLTSGMDRSEQVKFIESLPLPENLKEQMETYNNSAGYSRLKVTDFGGYIIGYIASMIMNIVAYLATVLLSWIIIRVLFAVLHVFANLPVVGTVDRIGGLLLGLVQGVFLVWILYLILSLFAGTQVGEQLMAEIYQNPLLEFLYNTNIFMNSATGAIRGIM